MVTRIGSGRRQHLYITQHREAHGLSVEELGARLEVSRTTMWRWEKEQWRLNPEKIAAIAYALGIEPEQLWRLPERPSIDAMLDEAPQHVHEAVADLAKRLSGR